MRRIVIVTGIYPPQIGGPAQYAFRIREAFINLGYDIKILTYGVEHFIPSGLRHLFFLLKSLPRVWRSDWCLVLDTLSVGWPMALACRLLGKKMIIRTGGDFLWESYAERTGKKVLLSDFYKSEQEYFTFKERLIFKLTKWTLRQAKIIVFSTDWQRQIWLKPYGIDLAKTAIVENYYGQKFPPMGFSKKVFVAGTRALQWKNLDLLKNIFEEIKVTNLGLELDLSNAPYEEFVQKIKNSYAVILVSLSDISPNMILDAVRCDKPFILTRENGLMGRLGDIGIFVDPLNVQEIKEKILWLADENNYQLVKKRIEGFDFTHSWQEMANEFIVLAEKP